MLYQLSYASDVHFISILPNFLLLAFSPFSHIIILTPEWSVSGVKEARDGCNVRASEQVLDRSTRYEQVYTSLQV